jgi:hypothetical protein
MPPKLQRHVAFSSNQMQYAFASQFFTRWREDPHNQQPKADNMHKRRRENKNIRDETN